MKSTILLGVLLVVLGAVMLGYGHFSYKTQEKILELGPIQATAEKTESIAFPPVLAWAFIGSGVCVLVIGASRRSVS